MTKPRWKLTDAALSWGVSSRRVRMLIEAGRVPGARLDRIGNTLTWTMPAGTAKPEVKMPGRKRGLTCKYIDEHCDNCGAYQHTGDIVGYCPGCGCKIVEIVTTPDE